MAAGLFGGRGAWRSLIETKTVWDDTGYDCDHCGGRLLRRTDHETGQPDRQCFQCEGCGCQWTADHHSLRVGSGPFCRVAQRERVSKPDLVDRYSRWLVAGLGVVALLLMMRFGGGLVLRLALPVVAIALVVIVARRYGRRAGWW